MNKFVKTGVLALAAIGFSALPLLSSCSGATVNNSLTAYWYLDHKANSNYENTFETLTYKVTFQKGNNSSYSFDYNEGNYVVTLKNGSFDGKLAYKLTGKLSISGTYTVGNTTSEPFADSIETVCYFRAVDDSLRPLYSERTVHSTSPAAQNATSLADAAQVVDYTVQCTYANDGKSATVKKDDHPAQTVALTQNSSTSFLDNEQLLFFPRAMPFGSASHNLSVFNAYAKSQQTLSVSAATATPFALKGFTMGENEPADYSVNCRSVLISDPSVLAGRPLSLAYAMEDSDGKNTFRHVLLAMQSPLSFNLGTLSYTLSSATFCVR